MQLCGLWKNDKTIIIYFLHITYHFGKEVKELSKVNTSEFLHH
jgi:hypothetical protein